MPCHLRLPLILRILQLGYSALVGLGVRPPSRRSILATNASVLQVLLLGFPVQFILVKIMFQQRFKGVRITDQRIRTTTEVLQGIRLVKVFAWEEFYTQQVGLLRTREIGTIKTSA